MREFIILDFSTGSELAQVLAEDAKNAVNWFLSTLESYELEEPPSLVAISPLSAQIAGEFAVSSSILALSR